MKNETYVQINKPCHEDWAQMTPEDQGRFCAHCNKSVIDFSLMTDNQILSHLNKSNTNLCGRFHSEQLLRPLIETQLEPKKNWRYWLASISALFLLTNKSTAQLVKGNNDPINTSVTPKDSLRLTKGKVRMTIGGDMHLKGMVIDSVGKPLWGATISTKGLPYATTSDSSGRFTLRLHTPTDTFTIVVAHVGHENKEVLIDRNKPDEQMIVLREKKKMLDEVVVVSYPYTKGKIDMGGFVCRVKPKKLSVRDTIPVINNFFKTPLAIIYPNPVGRNSSFHLVISTAGEYEVELLDNKSRLYYAEKHSTTFNKESIEITMPPNVVSGIYYVRLINIATKKQWVDKMIVR